MKKTTKTLGASTMKNTSRVQWNYFRGEKILEQEIETERNTSFSLLCASRMVFSSSDLKKYFSNLQILFQMSIRLM